MALGYLYSEHEQRQVKAYRALLRALGKHMLDNPGMSEVLDLAEAYATAKADMEVYKSQLED